MFIDFWMNVKNVGEYLSDYKYIVSQNVIIDVTIMTITVLDLGDARPDDT
jgi:hypothetical protein